MSSVEQVTSRDNLLEYQARARAMQERADSALEPWGIRAPALVAGESLSEYRRKLLITAKKQLSEDHELRRIQVRQLAPDALSVLEPRIYQACKETAYRPDSVAPGRIREVIDVDKNGLKIHKFIGTTWFGHQFTRPGRRAVIRTPDTHPGWFVR